MAKKRFAAGMEDLFNTETTEIRVLTSALSDSGEDSFQEEVASERKPASKRFSSQLEALLAEAFDNISEEGNAFAAPEDGDEQSRRPRSGLDLLIRSTTSDAEDFKPQSHTTRRVTLIFPKEHLEKLKLLAKQENVYLKDIINRLVSKYLTEKGL
jgi:hypothetical protein